MLCTCVLTCRTWHIHILKLALPFYKLSTSTHFYWLFYDFCSIFVILTAKIKMQPHLKYILLICLSEFDCLENMTIYMNAGGFCYEINFTYCPFQKMLIVPYYNRNRSWKLYVCVALWYYVTIFSFKNSWRDISRRKMQRKCHQYNKLQQTIYTCYELFLKHW